MSGDRYVDDYDNELSTSSQDHLILHLEGVIPTHILIHQDIEIVDE